MEVQILREILAELKGLRQGQGETNQHLESLERTTNERLDQTNQRLDQTNRRLDQTNQHLESLEKTTTERFESLEQRFGGLNETVGNLNQRFSGFAASVQVLTQGFSDARYELVEIKKLLATRVIWNNDNVALQVREGETLYGVIRKEERKE